MASAAGTDRSNLLTAWGDLLSLFGFGAGVGEEQTTIAKNFFDALLSGDPTKIAAVLGPQIGTLQQQGANQNATTAQFGNRSGGTNAATQATGANTISNIDSLIGNLTGNAATSVANLGQNALSLAGASAGTVGQQATSNRPVDIGQNNLLWSSLAQLFGPLINQGLGKLGNIIFGSPSGGGGTTGGTGGSTGGGTSGGPVNTSGIPIGTGIDWGNIWNFPLPPISPPGGDGGTIGGDTVSASDLATQFASNPGAFSSPINDVFGSTYNNLGGLFYDPGILPNPLGP